jgi:hypothetical protein
MSEEKNGPSGPNKMTSREVDVHASSKTLKYTPFHEC